MSLSIRSSLARFAAVLSIVLLAACGDPTREAAPTESQPAPAAAIAAPAGPNLAAAQGARIASTCRGYEKKRAGLRTALSHMPAAAEGAAKLRAQVAALDAMIADACN